MSQTPVPRYNVQGVGVSELTLGKACELLLGAAGTKGLGYVCLCTAYGVAEARRDPSFMRVLNESWLTTPDGMPIVWLGPPGVRRVYGPDLMLAVCDRGRDRGLRHFFYGGKPGVAGRLAGTLAARFPGLQVAGTFTPPFRDLTDDEFRALRDHVSGARADILWVGTGTPRQERFMAERGPGLDVGAMVGVGAAFDFLSGSVPQAPLWMRRSGLEWLFRLCTEPRRLGPRYLKTNTLFVLRLAAERLGLRRYTIGS